MDPFRWPLHQGVTGGIAIRMACQSKPSWQFMSLLKEILAVPQLGTFLSISNCTWILLDFDDFGFPISKGQQASLR